MRVIKILAVTVIVLLLASCTTRDTDNPETIVSQLKSNKLFVSEYVIHKLITDNDLNTFNITKNTSIDLSIGDRKIAIPMDAVLKAYIDFDSLSVNDIYTDGKSLSIRLKKPTVELTSSKIDHMAIREYTGIFRFKFSDEEMTELERQGRESIIASIPEMGITITAEENARELLIPILMRSGFDADKIHIEFKNDTQQ